MKLYSLVLFSLNPPPLSNVTSSSSSTTTSPTSSLPSTSFIIGYFISYDDLPVSNKQIGKQFIKFISREVIQRTCLQQRCSASHQQMIDEREINIQCHSYVSVSRLGAVAITDKEYNPRVAHTLLSKALEEVELSYSSELYKIKKDVRLRLPKIDELFESYKHPREVDIVEQLETEVSDVSNTVKQTIDELFLRGERLEDLGERSKDLSFQSKQFLKQSRKVDKCGCNVM